MGLSPGDILIYQGNVVATSFSTPNIGGTLGTLMTFGTVGELFFAVTANAFGGGSITQYSQGKIKNTNSTFDLVSNVGSSIVAAVYRLNTLSSVISAGTVSIVSDSALDTGNVVLGEMLSTGGNVETLVANGLTPVGGSANVTTGPFPWMQYQVAGVPTAANGNITLKDHGGNVVGKIPVGKKSADGLVSFWLPGALNTTDTIANAATAPAGASWSSPSTPASGLAIPGGSLPHTQYITCWTRLLVMAGCPSIPDLQHDFHAYGSG